MSKAIRDKRYHIIGYIDETATKTTVYSARNQRLGEIKKEGTKLIARDARLRKIAEYDESSNITRNAQYKQLEKGNILIDLLLAQSTL